MAADRELIARLPAAAEPARLPAQAPRKLPMAWLGLLLPAALLLGAELAVRAGWVASHQLPAPSDVLEALQQLAHQGLLTHIAASALRPALRWAPAWPSCWAPGSGCRR